VIRSRSLRFLLASLCLLPLTGCLSLPSPQTRNDAARLASAIASLSPHILPQEAELAASTAVAESRRLAQRYRTGSSPRLHNILVNTGLRERGLCWHYADDLRHALQSLRLRSLDVHEVVSREGSWLHEHNALVLTARGRDWSSGLLLDPWRSPGSLVWLPVREDTDHDWKPPSLGP
jgi:hypothetical protein